MEDVHRIQDFDQQGHHGERGEETPGLVVLVAGGALTLKSHEVNQGQISDAADGEPDPTAGAGAGKRAEQPGPQHHPLGEDGVKQVGAGQARQQSQARQDQRRGEEPVDVAQPEDLAVEDLVGVGDVLVGLGQGDTLPRDTFSGRQSQVDDEGDGCRGAD